MSTRNTVALVVVSVALTALVTFILAVGAVHDGPAGPAGDPGPQGPPGRSARASVSADAVVQAIEQDPEAVAEALRGHLDYEDIQANLDPDPHDVQANVDDLTEKLDSLCSDLAVSRISSDISTC